MRPLNIGLCAVLLLAAGERGSAWGAGYWNVPSNFCQCAGYGCGAGYHAPLVLGPVSWRGWLSKNEIRLPYSPRPPYGAYGYGEAAGRDDFSAPTMLEAETLPPPRPIPTGYRPPLRY